MDDVPARLGRTDEPHPDAAEVLDRLAAATPIHTRSIERARADYRARSHGEPSATVASVTDELVRTGGRAVPIRIYEPAGPAPKPVLLWAHAGGWVLGDLDGEDDTCRHLAAATGCVVVSVEYRLAPEHVFPAALEDYDAALAWVAEHVEGHGGDPDRIAVGGQGPGATLAAASTHRVRDHGGPSIGYQVLVIPVVNYAAELPSYEDWGEWGETREAIDWVKDNRLPHPVHGRNPYAFPLEASDFADLPPATVVTAGFDPRRDEGGRYAAALRDAGVDATLRHFEDVPHVFFGQLGEGEWVRAREAVDGVAADLADRFG